MFITSMFFYILVGLVLGARAITLAELEQRVSTVEQQLEYGGKKHQPLHYLNSAAKLKDHDYLRLKFLGARNGWLGCGDSNGICDLRRCPTLIKHYRNFGHCNGEVFQIIGKGAFHDSIKSGQQIRIRFVRDHNSWMGCPAKTHCGTSICPGTTVQASDFSICGGEIFEIYARGKTNGETIHNGDVVMLYHPGDRRYVSIQGENEADDTSLNYCPGIVPPAYLSYSICSKNAFQIYRKP